MGLPSVMTGVCGRPLARTLQASGRPLPGPLGLTGPAAWIVVLQVCRDQSAFACPSRGPGPRGAIPTSRHLVHSRGDRDSGYFLGLLKFSLRKALLRLRLLRGLGVGRVDCTHILKSLITPCIAWAAGYATPEASDIEAIRQETLYLFDYHAGGQTAAKVLVYEVLGWCLEPHFALDRAVMRLAWNFLLRPPAM